MQHPIATIFMENGTKIEIELYPEAAPNTVCSFLWLAEQGCFNQYSIQRIVPGYVADISYTAFGREECKYLIANEATPKDAPNHLRVEPGVIAMGGYDAGIAGGEFFFPFAYYEKLDGHYPAFGRIKQGWEEVKRWESVPLVPVPYPEMPEIVINRPVQPIVIEKVSVETFGLPCQEPEKLKVSYLPPGWK